MVRKVLTEPVSSNGTNGTVGIASNEQIQEAKPCEKQVVLDFCSCKWQQRKHQTECNTLQVLGATPTGCSTKHGCSLLLSADLFCLHNVTSFALFVFVVAGRRARKESAFCGGNHFSVAFCTKIGLMYTSRRHQIAKKRRQSRLSCGSNSTRNIMCWVFKLRRNTNAFSIWNRLIQKHCLHSWI